MGLIFDWVGIGVRDFVLESSARVGGKFKSGGSCLFLS